MIYEYDIHGAVGGLATRLRAPSFLLKIMNACICMGGR
jgi:hypothetical protein